MEGNNDNQMVDAESAKNSQEVKVEIDVVDTNCNLCHALIGECPECKELGELQKEINHMKFMLDTDRVDGIETRAALDKQIRLYVDQRNALLLQRVIHQKMDRILLEDKMMVEVANEMKANPDMVAHMAKIDDLSDQLQKAQEAFADDEYIKTYNMVVADHMDAKQVWLSEIEEYWRMYPGEKPKTYAFPEGSVSIRETRSLQILDETKLAEFLIRNNKPEAFSAFNKSMIRKFADSGIIAPGIVDYSVNTNVKVMAAPKPFPCGGPACENISVIGCKNCDKAKPKSKD